MASSKSKYRRAEHERRGSLVRLLAPEEIRHGDYVTVMNVVAELPSFLWNDAATLPAHEPVRLAVRPAIAGMPLKVKGICLPFVLVKLPWGKRRSLDVRQCRIARLDRDYAKHAWRSYKSSRRSCLSSLLA